MTAEIMLFLKFIAGLVVSYLVGSIPSAYLLGKFMKGIDIREHGSGNVGATNTFRVLGKGAGIFVLFLDIAKGLFAATVIGDLASTGKMIARILIGVFAVVGHNWTVFLEFKGGKGIATSLGVLIGLTLAVPNIRPVLLCTLLVWVAVFLVTGFVSLSSIIAGIGLPIFMLVMRQSFPMVFLGVLFCLFTVLRHKKNIKRLIAGEEPRVYFPFKHKQN